MYENMKKIDNILLSKIDLNQKDKDNNNYINLTCSLKNLKALTYFIEHKVDINNKNNDKLTPFHECCISGFYEGCKLLIKNKILINEQDKYGNTPLHYAIGSFYKKIIILILKQNVNIYVPNNDGKLCINLILKHFPLLSNQILNSKIEQICIIPSIHKKTCIKSNLQIYENESLISFNNKLKKLKKSKKISPLNVNKDFLKIKNPEKTAVITKINYIKDNFKVLSKAIKYKNGINNKWTNTMIDYYWTTRAKYIFRIQLSFYIIYTLIFTISSILYKYSINNIIITNITNSSLYFKDEYIPLYISDILLLIFNFGYTVNEIYEISKIKKCKNYFSNIWNIYDIFQNVGIYMIYGTRFINVDIEIVLLSSLSLIFWIKLFNFCRGFKNLGPLIRIIYKMISDIFYFMGIYLITFIAFTHSMFILLGLDTEGYINIFDTMITLFNMSIGDFDYQIIKNSRYFLSATIIFIIYNIMTVFIILNILIAILADSYTIINNNSNNEFRYEKAQLTMYLLSSLCSLCWKETQLIDNIDNLYLIEITDKDFFEKCKQDLPYYKIKN